MNNKLTIFIGKMGSGITLGAVIYIIDAKKDNKKLKIISNATLNDIIYKKFNLSKMSIYKNNLILIDNIEFIIDNIKFKSNSNRIKSFLKMCENNEVIITTHHLDYLNPVIQTKITKTVICSFRKKKNELFLVVDDKKYLLIKNVSQYFKYYNTKEIIKI